MNAEQTTTSSSPNADTRDTKGRFMPGNPGGPGNPFARQVASLRQALLNAVKPQDIQDVAAKLIELAKDGNVQAAKLLLLYAIGKPQPAVEPDRMDVDEWDVYRQQAPMKAESAAVLSAGTPEQHIKYVRVFRPIVSEIANEQVVQMFSEAPARRAEKERQDAEMEQHLNSPLSDPDLVAFAAQLNGQAPPSPYGNNGQAPPSSYGNNGHAAPSANGKKRRKPAPVDAPRPF